MQRWGWNDVCGAATWGVKFVGGISVMTPARKSRSRGSSTWEKDRRRMVSARAIESVSV